MTDGSTLQKDVASLLCHHLNVEVSSAHDDLIDSGLLDSLAIVELVVELESRFALKIPFEDLELDSFRSVAAIAHLIARLGASVGRTNVPAPGAPAQIAPLSIAD